MRFRFIRPLRYETASLRDRFAVRPLRCEYDLAAGWGRLCMGRKISTRMNMDEHGFCLGGLKW